MKTKPLPKQPTIRIGAPSDLLARLAKADTDATSAEHAGNMLVRFSEEARMIIRVAGNADPVSIAGLRRKHGDAFIIASVKNVLDAHGMLEVARKALATAESCMSAHEMQDSKWDNARHFIFTAKVACHATQQRIAPAK